MYVMTEEEKKTREIEKALHNRIREDAKKAMTGSLKARLNGRSWDTYISHREMLLIWGFARGFKFRRIERSHRMIDGVEQINISHDELAAIWQQLVPGVQIEVQRARFKEWLEDPSGAIPAPPPRPKRPYVAPEAAAAEE